uniref:Bestrophin homolog n=1 Tax=Setaria digitata TaxID=48799 RepID=A0A915Q4N3_9BILA
MIPIEFMLGFLVQAIITRWQKMIHDIGFIDSLSLTVAGYIHGNTDYSRMIRRNIVRYICLSQVLASRDFSIAVRKRFPTIDSIVAAANLCKFDWVPLPLAYPQLVYLAVHVHFLITLISKQEIIIPVLHRWCPLTPTMQFFFYMAWTKVAMVLINPFGEDDDDFETNALIDRNFKVGMRIVDSTSDDVPKQMKDPFWNCNAEALCSKESIRINEKLDGLVGSTIKLP